MTICVLGGTRERRAQDQQQPPGADGGGLSSPVLDGPGPRAHRVDQEPVRPGGQGGRAGLAAHLDRGDRHRPGDLRQVGGGPGGIHRAGHPGLQRRCRRDLRDRDHPAGPVQRRRGPAGGIRPDHRDTADRPRRRLRPRRCERPRPFGLQGHHGRDGAPRDGAAAACQQAGCGRARRAAHPAAGRVCPRRRRRGGDRPRCRGPGRHRRRVRRVHRVRVGLRGGRRVRRPPVPAARLRRGMGRAAALGEAHHARVIGILKNPCYAGAYVHGRYTSHRTVDPDGTVHTAITERPRAEWPVLIKDHHEGYITWADYLASETRLAANRTNAGARPPREGCALCQGIIFCGSCGKPMRTNYHTDQRPAYECSSRADRLTTPTCRSVAAATVDDAVAAALLDALTPEQVALALAAADEVAGRHQRVSRAAELAVERARYDADRAERAFHAVEPENRLVARSLEARWAARPAALAEAEQALEGARDALPPLPSRADLEQLAADLPALWHAPATSSKDRKRVPRTLIADVTLLPEPEQAKVRIGIRWHTGATDELSVARAIHPGTGKRSPSPAVEMVRQLGPVMPTAELAGQLNAAGLVTGHGRPFDVKAVQWIRHAYHISAPPPYAASEISVAEAARRLGCSAGVIYYWIESAQLDARRGPGNRLCITWNDQAEAACRRRIAQSRHLNPAGRRTRPHRAAG